MHVLALEIARRFPESVTLMIKGDGEVVADVARYLYSLETGCISSAIAKAQRRSPRPLYDSKRATFRSRCWPSRKLLRL
jgi:hypothetical protein